MSQIAEAFVKIRPDAIGFGSELKKQTEPQLNRFQSQMKSSNRELDRFGRGAVVGTGALRGLGRAAAFASVSFIGGAGLVYGIKSTVKAAMDAQASLAQTENAVKRSGLSWQEYGIHIREATLATANLSGFDDERLLRTFSNLVRKTGDVNKALQLNALAADVARGRGIELEAAQSLVIRASLGMSGALRRVGIAAKTNSTPLQLIQLLTEKYSGSAAKFADTAAGAQARFNVALQNTQEVLGQALLPSITDLLNKGTKWLNNTKNQDKLQRGLNDGLKVAGTAAEGTAKGFDFIGAAWNRLPDFGKHQGLFGILNDATGGGYGKALGTIGRGIGLIGDEAAVSAGKVSQFALALATAIPTAGFNPYQRFGGNSSSAYGATPPPPLVNLGGRTPSASVTRGDATATALAQAQAGGNRSAITAAANARIAFINDTIAFANKLLDQGRGNTKQLQSTLQKFYGEKDSVQGIITAFLDADNQAKKEAADKQAAAFAESQQLLIEQRAASKQAWQDYLDQQAQANAETQQLLIEQRAASKQGYSDFLKSEAQRKLDNLENNVLAARLITDPTREKKAEKTAQGLVVDLLRRRMKALKQNTVEFTAARRDYLDALQEFNNIGKGAAASGGFTLAQFYAEAEKEAQMYGSNIAAPGAPLSPQEARGTVAGIAKQHQTIVVQNFHYPMAASQALNDAHAAARNVKT